MAEQHCQEYLPFDMFLIIFQSLINSFKDIKDSGWLQVKGMLLYKMNVYDCSIINIFIR